jgi:pimeloyl-ACP methyl ester carboxylesterase
LEEAADAVAAHLRGEADTRWWLVGHSLGGKVAALTALRHPGLCAGVVCVDISLRPYDVTSPEWRQLDTALQAMSAVEGMDATDVRWRVHLDTALGSHGVADGGLRGHVGVNAIARADGRDGTKRVAWRVPPRILRDSLPAFADFPPPPHCGPYAAATDVEFHAVRGGRSPYAPFDPVDSSAGHGAGRVPLAEQVAEREAYARFFPRSHFHTVSGAGHFVMGDQPAAFARLLAAVVGA